MNNFVTAIVSVAVVGVIGVGAYFAWPIVFPSLEQQCINAWHDQFLDPKSVSPVTSYVSTDDDKEIIHVQVRGKNAFGAYNFSMIECPITRGKIDQLYTDVHRLTSGRTN